MAWRLDHLVIQSTRLEVERLGQREFELTEAEWQEQARQNAGVMSHFMNQLGDALEDATSDEDEDCER